MLTIATVVIIAVLWLVAFWGFGIIGIPLKGGK